ncbi:hypothetical protein KC336_g17368 [Hortaea werneckii]|nr:hypothetical protein KC336_g17368 [Hortaea werneckii]
MDKFNEVWDELGLPYSDPEGGYFVLVNFTKVKLPEDYEFPPHVASRPRDFKLSWFFIKELGIAAIPPTEFFTDANAHIVEDWLRFAVMSNIEVDLNWAVLAGGAFLPSRTCRMHLALTQTILLGPGAAITGPRKCSNQLNIASVAATGSKTSAKMHNFDTVPSDIKYCVLHLLPDPRDLYSLILTCKGLRDAAVPFYYNTVHVHGNVALPVLAAGLVPTNPGLQHIRHLVIKEPCGQNALDHVSGASDSRTEIILTFLANLLPHDRLLTFTCDCDVSLPTPILATLYRRQHKLRTLRLDSVGLEPVIASFSQDSLANIATVHICTADPKEASSWNRLLPTLPNLQNLEIAANTDRSDGVFAQQADGSSKVLAKLLDWTTQESQDKLRLHTLQVQGFDLTDAAENLQRNIHFPGLKVLGMQLCTNTAHLLRVLYKAHELASEASLSLRILILVQAEKVPESRVYNAALSRLLSTSNTLQHLIVRTKGDAAYWPDPRAVSSHAASIRLLHLDCPWPEPISRGHRRGGSSLRSLIKLEHFTISTSSIVLAEADRCGTAECYTHMRKFLVFLDGLPALQTLRIVDIRLGDLEVRQDEPQVLQGYILRQMRTLADYIFTAVSKLQALSLEQCVDLDRNPNARGKTRTEQFYHRGKTSDAQGREQTTAIEASLRELGKIEEAVVILDMKALEHGGLFRYGYDR